MFNTKSRAMCGLIMLTILFGLFITGIEVTPNRRGKGKQKTSDLVEIRRPLLDYGEEEEVENFPSNYLIKGENITEKLFASMNLVKDKKSTEVNSLPNVDFIRGREMKILSYAESFYRRLRNEQSSSLPRQLIGIPKNDNEKFGLVYVTYLSFWMAVNFRLCSVLFSLLPAYSYEENIKLACDEHFATMAFAFSESQKILDSIGIKFCQSELESVESYLLELNLDFVMNEDELKKRAPSYYVYYSGHILWEKVPNEKIAYQEYKTNFRSVASFHNRYHQEIGRCNTPSEMFEFLFNILNSQIKSDNFTEISETIRCHIYGMKYRALREKPDALWPPTWFTSNYENTKKMWQHVAKTKFRKSINTEDVDETIQTAFNLIYEVRNVDYTLAYGSLLDIKI